MFHVASHQCDHISNILRRFVDACLQVYWYFDVNFIFQKLAAKKNLMDSNLVNWNNLRNKTSSDVRRVWTWAKRLDFEQVSRCSVLVKISPKLETTSWIEQCIENYTNISLKEANFHLRTPSTYQRFFNQLTNQRLKHSLIQFLWSKYFSSQSWVTHPVHTLRIIIRSRE